MTHHLLIPAVVLASSLGATTALAAPPVVINEIHHSPDRSGERVEFIELHNRLDQPLDLNGWNLSEAVDYTWTNTALIPAHGFRVVAASPPAIQTKFGLDTADGPWRGRLGSRGDRIVLRNPLGERIDEVEYQLGFPWPTVGEPPGYSIELIHPDLDNDLGGHWRASSPAASAEPPRLLIEPGSTWLYRKGISEPSSPRDLWRQPGFDDATWTPATLPIGYDPAVPLATRLDDMRGSYLSVHLRKTFLATDTARIQRLRIQATFDDGIVVWLNGHLLFSDNMPSNDPPFSQGAITAIEDGTWREFNAPIPPGVLVDGRNTLAVHLANANLADSSDAFFDARIEARFDAQGGGPSPGRPNLTLTSNAPPAIRQVRHLPTRPQSQIPLVITAKITDPDGVRSVVLEYQLVEPGRYIRSDAPAYATHWTALPMLDNGQFPDTDARDDTYAVQLPASLSRHRHLIRYRITALDTQGNSVRVPYPDDGARNFAAFVHDGVPEWHGAIQPGSPSLRGAAFAVPASEMNRLPVYHLLALEQDVRDATWFDRSRGDDYAWLGTLVHEGDVYENVRFRPRGGVWRYAMGKNMWKFDFQRGHDFQARDDWGRPMKSTWAKLNLGACIQQGDYLHRGEQGMFESVGFRLFNLAGVPAPQTAHVQFRIIDTPTESSPDNQYDGDFWGVYLAVEQPDGRFLDAHNLPDGNLYKMESGFGTPNHLAEGGPVDASDLQAFLDGINANGAAQQDPAWWQNHLHLDRYYGYQTIVQAIHHYDIAGGKNYFYYHDATDDRWSVLPWDLDLTWSDNMYVSGQTGGDEPFKALVLSDFSNPSRFPGFTIAFRNRVREILDLLFNPDAMGALIDEQALRLRGTALRSILDADRAQWDYNPVMADSAITLASKAGHGRFYQSGLGSKDFAGMVRKMKAYVGYRSTNTTFSLTTLARDSEIPGRPVARHTGPRTFPVDQLSFEVDPYSGTHPGRSVIWRAAEIDHASPPPDDHPSPVEIEGTWTSPELDVNQRSTTIPGGLLKPGRHYRVRARFTDLTGRNSHWSVPIEFTAGTPANASPGFSSLQITEIMYHPASDAGEFIEILNRHPSGQVRLDGLQLSGGIRFSFPPGLSLAPGRRAVIIDSPNLEAFRTTHAVPADALVLGPFEGALDNGGETLTLADTSGNTLTVSYDDAAPWPTRSDGAGRSLVPRIAGVPNASDPFDWRASTLDGGSPGRDDLPPAMPTLFRLVPAPAPVTGVALEIQTTNPTSWVLERSPDLEHWTPINAGEGPGVFQGSTAAGTAGFYRLVLR